MIRVATRLVALALALLVLLGARRALADRCAPSAEAWVARCAAKERVAMSLLNCPNGIAIVELRPEGASSLRVEISVSPKAFRHVGAHGLAPVGSFDDWESEPAPRRAALDALVRCAERESPEVLYERAPGAQPSPGPSKQDTRGGGAGLPLLPIAALSLAMASCLLGRPRLSRAARLLAGSLAALAAVVLLRRALQVPAFFHQNGQGPVWVGFAVSGDAHSYGPGFPELFHWLTALANRPDLAIFRAQELLAATVPISAYAITRRVGGAKPLALVFAVALAVDPVLTRTARSESYFATISALLFAACALCAASADLARAAGRWAKPAWMLAIGAAALLVAQAARIHPLAWVPCAMVPMSIACRRGALRKRAQRALAAAAVIGIVALPLVLPTMRATLSSQLGGEFAPGAGVLARHLLPRVAMPVAAAALLLVSARTRPLGSRAVVAAVVLGAAMATNVVALDMPSVSGAYLHLFAPALLAAVAGLIAIAPARPAMTGALAVLALLHGALERSKVTLPTDALELAWAQEWRETLPSHAHVAAVQRVERRMLTLPLFGQGLPKSLSIDEGFGDLRGGGPHYYYRSSLCVSPEGAPVCAAFEAKHRLRPMASRRLPLRASLPWLPLPSGEVEVVLFAVDP